MSKSNAEAVICGETYDVEIVGYPDEIGLCKVNVLFENGEYIEVVAVMKENIWPRTERAITLLMGAN